MSEPDGVFAEEPRGDGALLRGEALAADVRIAAELELSLLEDMTERARGPTA